jgi:dTDP-4-amino-4,6-dideoxygalactose transaminase
MARYVHARRLPEVALADAATAASPGGDAWVPFTDLRAMTLEVETEIWRGWSAIVESSAFIGGSAVELFEQQWAEYCGTAHAVGVANGTDALQLTLMALGIGPGDEVIVPANTFIATAEAVVLSGATPRFVDVDPHTLLITPETVEASITDETRALIVVHLYGQLADMDALRALTDRAGIMLIEDAAQAHGGTWQGYRAGSFGVAGCFSFYPGKNLGAFGDAGAVVCSDPVLAQRLRSMRDHGRVAGSHYQHDMIATNSRLDALQAVVLSAKLARLEAWNESRRSIMASYRAAASAGSLRFIEETPGARGVYHLAVARVSDRSAAERLFAERHLQTAVHYPTPCHLSGPYRRFADSTLPVAEGAAGQIISLPLFPHMDQRQVARVCEAISELDQRLVYAESSSA